MFDANQALLNSRYSSDSSYSSNSSYTSKSHYPNNFEHWYVVQCKPRQERRAQNNILNQFGEVLLFERPVEKIRSGSRLSSTELWFPGYVFVRMPQDHRLWSTIRSTYGVSKLVRFGERAIALRPETLRGICDAVRQANERPSFKKGDTVEVIAGPLKGMQGIFSAYDGKARALLLISFLQRDQLAQVPLDQLGH